MGYGAPPRRSATLRERLTILKWITRVPMTLKKTKEIIGSYLEKVKVSPETDPEIQENHIACAMERVELFKKICF